MYTLKHEPRYQTSFTVNIDHPLISKDFVMTSDVRELISSSEMFGIENISPHLSYSQATKRFTITSNTKEIHNDVETLFKISFEARIKDLIKTANNVKIDQIDLLSDTGKNFAPSMLLLLIEKKELNDVKNEAMRSLKFNFGPTITFHPKVKKYGFIGVILGLFAGILMVIVSILFDSIKSRQNTRSDYS